MAARKTEAQMDPGIPHLQTFLAAIRFGCDLADLIAMRAIFRIASTAPNMFAKGVSGGQFAFSLLVHKFRLNTKAGEDGEF